MLSLWKQQLKKTIKNHDERNDSEGDGMVQVMERVKLQRQKQADPSSDKREKEQAADNREVQDRLENYLWKHYEFRFNVLTEQPEYCAKGQGRTHLIRW